MIDECMYKLQKKIVRRWLLDEQQAAWTADGMDEIRPLAAEVGAAAARTRLRPVHQRPDAGAYDGHARLDPRFVSCWTASTRKRTKRYMHQYNMPGYSVGEAKAARSARPPRDRPRRAG